jgi:hypothetical protein
MGRTLDKIETEMENKTMIYKKPQLVVLENALRTVRGQTKLGAVPDSVAPHNRPSLSAYEADE